jgi:phenylalanyl-tRNA synthetase beta chain
VKISYNWLKDFTEIPVDAQTLGQRLTHVGLALESCEPIGDDMVLDLDVTTNRPDCLSHLGVAREVGAIYKHAVRKPQFHLKEAGKSAADVFSISIEDPAPMRTLLRALFLRCENRPLTGLAEEAA